MWLLPVDICASVVIRQQIGREREREGVVGAVAAALHSGDAPTGSNVVSTTKNPPLPCLSGHEPHRHTVETGHRSGSQPRGVRLQPPAERARAAAAAGAAGGEEAPFGPGAREGPAGTAAAR